MRILVVSDYFISDLTELDCSGQSREEQMRRLEAFLERLVVHNKAMY